MIELAVRDCIKIKGKVFRILLDPFDRSSPYVLSPVLTEEIARLEDEEYERLGKELSESLKTWRPELIEGPR